MKSFKLPAVIVRLNNVYGPHQVRQVPASVRIPGTDCWQYPEKFIPKFINLLQRQRPLSLHGDGQHTRRYLYAGDAADAFDTILHKGVVGQIYNVDSRDEISNVDLAKKLLAVFGITDVDHRIQYTQDRPFNDRRYAVDGSKLRKLGWKQNVSFEDGLAATVRWYGKFSSWWGQIDAILSPFPIVEGDHVVSALAKADGEVNVGALDDRGHTAVNGHSKQAGVPEGAKKRKAGDMDGDMRVMADGLIDEDDIRAGAKKRRAEDVD